jgi:hypothetical protein
VDTLVYALGLFLVGIHAMTFAASSKIYAMSAGLLPPDPKFQRVFKYLNLERGLLAGLFLLLAGFASAALSVSLWFKASLGNLNPSQMLRITLPSALSIFLGFELGLLSFFLSLLGMPKRSGASNVQLQK